MTTYFRSPVRALLVAAILMFAAQVADARSTATTPAQTTTAPTKGDAPPQGTSIDGILLIVGLVGVVILLAWVCSRVGDSR